MILLVFLGWLDLNRGGPASELTKCNLALTKSGRPPAQVLIIGSSRIGTALDPLAVQEMLQRVYPTIRPTVERLAIGHNPLRAEHALLNNYLRSRGSPKLIVLEPMVMTERSIEKLMRRHLAISPEEYIFRRDLNVMNFRQILSMPAVAMPYTQQESFLNGLRFKLRGVVLRAGALAYEFFRNPLRNWNAADCDVFSWTHEPEWPNDFAFSYGTTSSTGTPVEIIAKLMQRLSTTAADRSLKEWQKESGSGHRYPYDFAEPYRAGELAFLMEMIEQAESRDIPVLLTPLPLYGYEIGIRDAQFLRNIPFKNVDLLDLYAEVGSELDYFWYDDGHIELDPAGALTSAILAKHIVESHLLDLNESNSRD